MYRSLLVPLDGSAFAEQALPLTLGIARRAGAALNVVQVHQPLTPAYADSIAPGTCEVEARVLDLDFPDDSVVSAWRLRMFPRKSSVSDDFLPK
jgi:nucleotide-binding universal stress UspA family protein